MSTFKRKIFYVSGFDPRGPRFYHDLYVAQAERYGRLAEEPLTVSERRRGEGHSAQWQVDNPTADVTTDYCFLSWDDLVRRAWVTNPLTLLLRSARAYFDYARKADWPRVVRLPRAPLITLFYPPISTVLIPILFFLVDWGIASLFLPGKWALLIGAVVGLAAAFELLRRMRSLWLLRFFIYNNDLSRHGFDPALDQRLDEFAALIAKSFAEEHDEILLITHSNGSILAVPLLDKLIALRSNSRLPAHFALVTLGQCIPLISYRRDAHAFRMRLASLSDNVFRWVDIGFPPDGACYAMVDPFANIWPKPIMKVELVSARLFRFYSKRKYRQRRRNKYELHFDYLRCGSWLSPIDHPSMTAGRHTLSEALQAFRAMR